MIKKIPLIQMDDYKIQQVQQNIVSFLNQFSNIQILDGTLLQSVSITAASMKNIQHKLGRAYVGYIVTNKNANAGQWVGDTSEKDIYLKLRTSADCTVDIWVF